MSWTWILSVPGNYTTCVCVAQTRSSPIKVENNTKPQFYCCLHSTVFCFSFSPHRIYWVTRSLISSSRWNYLSYVPTDAVICVHIIFQRNSFTGSWSIKAEKKEKTHKKHRSSTVKLAVDLLFFSLKCLMSGATIHQFQPLNKQATQLLMY